MTRLYGREYEFRFGPPGEEGRVFIGGDDAEGKQYGLEMSFDVTKSLKKSSNKAKVTLYNLAPASLGALEASGAVVQLIAGYRDNKALLFSGSVAKRGVVSTWDGTTLTTEVDAGDGELELAKTRSDISLAVGATSVDALRLLLAQMGVGAGNIEDVVPRTYLSGYVHAGLARDAITEICRDAGVAWSLQDGAFLGLAPGASKAGAVAVLLNEGSGLIGTPAREKAGLQAVSLLQPRLAVGGLVRVESRLVTGDYKITEVKHSGSFRGAVWFSEIKGKPRT